MNRTASYTLLLLLVLTSCRSAGHLSDETGEEKVSNELFYSISEQIEKDPEMEELLNPWREIYNEQMNHSVATATADFTFGLPESSLGNLTADIIRYRASHEMQTFVHLALISYETIKAELEQGDISLGDVYEILPDDDELVISEIRGEHVRELADEVAASGGAPVSGLRMTINNGSATGILVNSESIDPEKIYYVATSSEMAGGPSGFDALNHSSARHESNLLIRDIFIDYMRSRKVFTPVEDQRIRGR